MNKIRRPPAVDTSLRLGRDLAAFAARWQPFGGPPDEEVLPTFGMTTLQYLSRLGHLLDFYDSDMLQISPQLHELIRSEC